MLVHRFAGTGTRCCWTGTSGGSWSSLVSATASSSPPSSWRTLPTTPATRRTSWARRASSSCSQVGQFILLSGVPVHPALRWVIEYTHWVYTVRKEIKCSGDTEILHELVYDTTYMWISSRFSYFHGTKTSWTNSWSAGMYLGFPSTFHFLLTPYILYITELKMTEWKTV